jgi:hypothetical protein
MSRHISRLAILGAFSMVFFIGCATQGVNTFRHSDGNFKRVNNEKVVSHPQSQVWDGLVKELSKSFFVINNIDKESRIINLSFNTDSPQEYIDCGKTYRTYTQGGKVVNFEYEVAGPSQYKMASPNQPGPAFSGYIIVNRRPVLEGRSNIYIAPDEINKNNSIITVNTRYIFTTKTKGTYYIEHFSGKVTPMQNIPEESFNVSFNTAELGKHILIDGTEVKCFSKGLLEERILQMVKD